jgi:hypothetical protein
MLKLDILAPEAQPALAPLLDTGTSISVGLVTLAGALTGATTGAATA